MGFVEIYLSDEDKFKVLLSAFGLFLLALLCSICLALSCCPLNKWLLERSSRKRRQQLFHQQQQQQQHATQSSTPVYLLTGGYGCGPAKVGLARAPSQVGGCLIYGNRANLHQQRQRQQALRQASNVSYGGPPPAYEAALRATRLQSLTGTLPQLYQQQQQQPEQDSAEQQKEANQWPPQMVYNGAADRELDLGDYFHQPKEFTSLEPPPPPPHIQLNNNTGDYATHCKQDEQQQRHMPVMLRLWVRVMEPGELVQRARGSEREQKSREQAAARSSLSRQLSIPQLFGSLVTLASGKQQAALADGSGGDNLPPANLDQQQQQQDNQVVAEREMHSIISTSTSSSARSDLVVAETKDEELEASSKNGGQEAKVERKKQAPQPRRRSSSFLAINSVTSRVLHMNVASFSYVRDEQLISTKKHNQLNYHHFFTSSNSSNKTTTTQSETKNKPNNGSKLCQLVISICDIENILSSCWSNEKSCALLAYSSAIYVQCEILLPKSKSARLLSYPLKALNPSSSSSSSTMSSGSTSSGGGGGGKSRGSTHTVNFSTAIPAAALERQQPNIGHHFASPLPAESICGEPGQHLLQVDMLQHNSASSADTSLNGSVMSDSASSSALPPTSGQSASDSSSSSSTTTTTTPAPTTTNWRHEPQADGKSIVIFNSVPKQIAHEQELAATSFLHQQETDLIQFDSVFVSPILNKSTIEDGFLRFRVYSQCKYVNETCLAELKLPLKQLLRSGTRDNLGDASLLPRATMAPGETTSASTTATIQHQQQKQADFILDNLLENLVTANTGSPLSTLIEQISTEEREAEELEQAEQLPASSMSVFSRLPWLLSQHQDQQQQQSSAKKLKLSSSLNESLYRLGTQAASSSLYQHQSQQQQHQHQQMATAANSDTQLYLGDGLNQDEVEEEERQRHQAEKDQEAHDRLMEQNYCRSLMVSHWLNYLVAPSYECQLGDDSKGKVILGLTYLPTSNRLIFNAHKASIDADSYGFGGSTGKHVMKNLQLQSSTCYLLRFLMIVNGRVVKRKQTAVGRRPEWDIQEPITFDLASVSVAQPHFIVALVMRNATGLHSSTGSLQNLQQRYLAPGRYFGQTQAATNRQPSGNGGGSNKGAYSEPESGRNLYGCFGGGGSSSIDGTTTTTTATTMQPHHRAKRDLVIGHMVIGEEMWRELRLKPRKQIVRQFKIY